MARDITVSGLGGEYMDTATVVAWHVQPGEAVRAGDLLATVETAKAATDIEAPCDGVLSEVCAVVGEEVAAGSVLGRLDDGTADTVPEADVSATPSNSSQPTHSDVSAGSERSAGRHDRVVASPLARRVARDRGIDLATVPGTGPNGRIKLRDVEGLAGGDPPRSATAVRPRPTSARADASIVLIHGLGATPSIWHQILPTLGQTAARVERLTLPGHGDGVATERMDFESLLDAMRSQLGGRDLDGVHLVGHSLGGAVALALADERPALARSLTLIAPAGLGPEIDGAFLAGFARATRPDSLRPWLERLVADPECLPAGLAEAALQARGAEPAGENLRRLIDSLFPDGTQAFDLRSALHRVRVPARLVWGRRDRIIPWRHALAAPGAVAMHLLPETGHLPQIEAPDLVAALIQQTVAAALAGP